MAGVNHGTHLRMSATLENLHRYFTDSEVTSIDFSKTFNGQEFKALIILKGKYQN